MHTKKKIERINEKTIMMRIEKEEEIRLIKEKWQLPIKELEAEIKNMRLKRDKEISKVVKRHFVKTARLKYGLVKKINKDPYVNERYNRKIDRDGISVRLANRLDILNIDKIGDLARFTEEEFLKIPGIGRSTFKEAREILADNGLIFGLEK